MPAKAKKTSAPKSPATLCHAAKKFNAIIILDTGPQFTAAEAELRLRTMALHHTKGAPLPPIIRVSALDVSPMASAMALYRAWRAVGHGSPALYLCATTTGNATLTMLTTDWGNTVIGPNDGTLSLLGRLFAERHVPFELHSLDLDHIIAVERLRMDNPDWEPAPDFALRDYLAPAAALQIAGLDSTDKNSLPLNLTSLPFAEGSHTLRLKLHESQPAYALPTGNGSFLLNLTIDPLSFDQLLDDQAQFTLEMHRVCTPCQFRRLFQNPTVRAEQPVPPPSPKRAFVRGVGSLSLDGTLAPAWDERFLTLHLGPYAPAQADHPLPLTLTRQK
jgi:hypothetical protein